MQLHSHALSPIRLRRIDAHSPDVRGEVVRLTRAIHVLGLGADVAQRVGQVVLASHGDHLAIDAAPVIDVEVRHRRVESAIVGDCEARRCRALRARDGSEHRFRDARGGPVVAELRLGRDAVAWQRREKRCVLGHDGQARRAEPRLRLPSVHAAKLAFGD